MGELRELLDLELTCFGSLADRVTAQNRELEQVADEWIAAKRHGWEKLKLIRERDSLAAENRDLAEDFDALDAATCRYREALRYIMGEDVAGYEAHMRPEEVARAALDPQQTSGGVHHPPETGPREAPCRGLQPPDVPTIGSRSGGETCPTCGSDDPEICTGTGRGEKPHPHTISKVYPKAFYNCCPDEFHGTGRKP